jgi:peptidyl-tRNA hydrolase
MRKADEEKRIYIVVPETVQVQRRTCLPWNVSMEPGRLMAQCAHVARKLENQQLEHMHEQTGTVSRYKEMTTIVLSVRNSKELEKVAREAADATEFFHYFPFRDTNPGFYGTTEKVFTAFAVGPVTQSEMDPILGHLPLYGA